MKNKKLIPIGAAVFLCLCLALAAASGGGTNKEAATRTAVTLAGNSQLSTTAVATVLAKEIEIATTMAPTFTSIPFTQTIPVPVASIPDATQSPATPTDQDVTPTIQATATVTVVSTVTIAVTSLATASATTVKTSDPTLTPSPITTATPTVIQPTPTQPAPTTTPTRAVPTGTSTTVTASARVVISGVHNSGQTEYVTITNQGNSAQDMSGWKINAGLEGQNFSFPDGFVLQARASVKVHSGSGATDNPPSDLKWNTPAVWNNNGDKGFLYDNTGRLVSQYEY